jgi:hypothetical protein
MRYINEMYHRPSLGRNPPTRVSDMARSLSPGTRLEPREILSAIGAGGASPKAPAAMPSQEATPSALSHKPDTARTRALPLDEALAIARQIAAALEAAHEPKILDSVRRACDGQGN